jgi:hypothetical protein
MSLVSKLKLRIALSVFLLIFAPDSLSAVWRATHGESVVGIFLLLYLTGSFFFASASPSWKGKFGRFNLLVVLGFVIFRLLGIAGPGMGALTWIVVLLTYSILGNLQLVIYHSVQKKWQLITIFSAIAVLATTINFNLLKMEIEDSRRKDVVKQAQEKGSKSLNEGLQHCAQLGPVNTTFRSSCEDDVRLAFGQASKDIFDCKLSAHRGFVFGTCLRSHPKRQTLGELNSLCDQEKAGSNLEMCKMQLILYAGSINDCSSLTEYKQWCTQEFGKN